MFVCKYCMANDNLRNSQVFIDQKTVGIASVVTLRCAENHTFVLKNEFKPNDSGKLLTQQSNTLGKYSNNYHLVLGMLCNGLGFSGLSTMIGTRW